jgi:hypothetical protein
MAAAVGTGIVIGWEPVPAPMPARRLSRLVPCSRRWGTMSMRLPSAACGWKLRAGSAFKVNRTRRRKGCCGYQR